jgi:hypothetical protein
MTILHGLATVSGLRAQRSFTKFGLKSLEIASTPKDTQLATQETSLHIVANSTPQVQRTPERVRAPLLITKTSSNVHRPKQMASALRLRQRLSGLKNSIRVGFLFLLTCFLCAPSATAGVVIWRNALRGRWAHGKKIQNSRLIQMCPEIIYTTQRKQRAERVLLAHYTLKNRGNCPACCAAS